MTPTLPSAIRRMVDERLREVNTCIPARVESFSASDRTITAQPMVPVSFLDEEGERQTENLPAIPHVPLIFPGSGSASLTFPVTRGDTVLLLFSQGSIDRWFVNGRLEDSGDDRHHALSDAVAIPGILAAPAAEALDPVHASAVVLTASELRLGGTDASEPTFKADSLDTAIGDALTGLLGALTVVITATQAPGTYTAPVASAWTGAISAFNIAMAAAKTSIVKVK